MKIVRDGRQIDARVTPEAGTAFSGAFQHPDVERMPGFRFDGPPLRFETPHREWFPDVRGRSRRQPRLGVAVQGLSGQLAEYFGTKEGVLVTTVREGSPAETAGLKAGDVITAVDGKTVSSAAQLADVVRDLKTETIKISYVRNRKTADVQVKVPARERRPGRPGRPA
jgi:S1-C subfamily serine protease